MDAKLVMILAGLLLLVQRPVEADFLYNRKTPKTPEELETLGLKCVPGRTIIKIESLVPKKLDGVESEEDDVVTDARRTHMNSKPNGENCQICVCSVEGKDEYCSRRPARNVNECIRMGAITESLKKNLPYEHERSLAFRIRRDYLWHKDEIPYSASDHCYRGNSYYTNNDKANETTLDKQARVASQLDYVTRDMCYYCVCPTYGGPPGCIRRNPWFCDYYRIIRRPNYARDRYRYWFKEDRPAYFRQLSFRIRRTMDDGLQELLENVGDSVNKNAECVPLVSEYTDCTEANICSGCSRCTCTVDGEWSCKIVHECPSNGDDDLLDEDTITNAYEVLFNELASMENTKASPVSKADGSSLLDFRKHMEVEKDKKHWMSRIRRSINPNPKIQDPNGTVRFYHTVDELNEDTLKNTNDSGTIVAKKVEGVKIAKNFRRTSPVDSSNITGISDLHIDFSQPRVYDHHINDNKIDSTQNEHKMNLLTHAKINEIIGNYSQSSKDKDLSKLVVNELRKGSETIGNKRVTPVSNITFTPENDTLTAMAFIAGNLLSKLWQIEKDSSAESIETEILKHEKIADLLELFKEPLTMRQEVFIKNALDKLSKALNKESKVNISLCEALASTETSSNSSIEDVTRTETRCESKKYKNFQNTVNKKDNDTVQAITKINSVLNLINKFDNVQKHLHLLRNGMKSSSELNKDSKLNSDLNSNENENKSMNVFGNLLEKLTKLILPKKSKKSKKLVTEIRHMNLFSNSEDVRKNLKQIININNDNLTLTSKDKLVIDYINVFTTSDCALRGNLYKEINSFPNVSGNVIDSLKKLLNIKSVNDLVDQISPKTGTGNKNHSMSHRNEEDNARTTETSSSINNNEEDQLLKTAKGKLKKHLNAILDDLIELNNESGIALRASNKSVADVLPCIYNLLNADKEQQETSQTQGGTSFLKVKTMFQSLKDNFEYGSLSRRSEFDFAETPQSSKVWERIIKNLNKKNTRRTFNGIPKSFQKLKQMIDSVDISSNSYKDYLTLADVPVASHLVLLKVIEASVNQIANTLKDIKLYIETPTTLPNGEEFELQRFVDNAVQSVNLNYKILEKLKAFKSKKTFENNKNVRSAKMTIVKPFMQSPGLMHRQIEDSLHAYKTPRDQNASDKSLYKLKPHKFGDRGDSSRTMKKFSSNKQTNTDDANVFKLTRDQILNQLIKNRLQLYLQMREAKRSNLNQDVNYNLANTMMNRLENGDNGLANDLFKMFIENSENEDMYRLVKDVEATSSQKVQDTDPSRHAPNNLEIFRTKFKDYQEDNLLKQLLMITKL